MRACLKLLQVHECVHHLGLTPRPLDFNFHLRHRYPAQAVAANIPSLFPLEPAGYLKRGGGVNISLK